MLKISKCLNNNRIQRPPPLPPAPEQFALPESFSTGSRLRALDLIRGVAILGILPVHIGLFSGTDQSLTADPIPTAWSDHAITLLVMLLFEGKMVTLLSILFGAGLAIQADNASVAGRPFTPYFRRRMLVLFLIGLGHALFLFQFDILTSYAVVGVIALFLIGKPQKTLLRIAAGCLAWCYGIVILFTLLFLLLGSAEPEAAALAPMADATAAETADADDPVTRFFSVENETRIFREGSLWEMMLHRLAYLVIMGILFWVATGWYLLACVLIGIWLVRAGVFHHFESHQNLSRRLTIIGLTLGLSFHLAGSVAYLLQPEGMLYYCLVFIGMIPLAFVHLVWLTRWAQTDRAPWLQSHLAAVGRMAFSNYLMQSFLCGIVFYSYGFGLYGQIGRASTFAVVLGIWLFQLLVCQIWLQRFKIGPAEWLWRSLTEGRKYQPA